jgi:hypothetical protein
MSKGKRKKGTGSEKPGDFETSPFSTGLILEKGQLRQQQPRVDNSEIGCTGFCRQCGREHRLPAGPAYQASRALMAELQAQERIDLHLPAENSDPRFSTDYLFGPARGKMFGVMVAATPAENIVTLRAFSGQYNGFWEIPGWVGPTFSPDAFHQLHDAEEQNIKALGRRIDAQEPGSQEREKLTALRKNMSRRLMADIHELYRLKNFCGQAAGLEEIFPPGMGIPTGTGDCCGPKLLQYAAEHGFTPHGIAEFYWGRATASGSRQHGRFYSSCPGKCYPILGFMLCGLKERTS